MRSITLRLRRALLTRALRPFGLVVGGALLLAAGQPGRAADPPAQAPAKAAAVAPFTKVATVEGMTEYKLANGFRVVLYPDPSKPLLTINNTVLVGSRHEGLGEAGMAHLLEHMLLKGTPTFPDVHKELRAHGAGGRYNATTNVDRTNFFETMPASDANLEFGIRFEADRMVNSFIKREDLIAEMTVVRNEFEMYENSPTEILNQRMNASAFEFHPYGRALIGNRSDIERVPVDKLHAFYKKFYRVDNAVLVVAGQFDAVKALAHVVKYFGPLTKPADPVPTTYTEEPAQDGERQVTLRRVGTTGAVGVAYHVPAAIHPDAPALQILTLCLKNAPSGSVYKALVEGKKAASVGGAVSTAHDPGLLSLVALVEDPKGVDAARDALIAAMEGLAATPVTEAEVERYRDAFKVYFDAHTPQSNDMADTLSDWAGIGDWRLYFVNRDRLAKVTAADVNRVAAAYLKRDNRTVGVYYPTDKPARAAVPATPAAAAVVAAYKATEAGTAVAAFEPTPANIEKHTVRGTLGNLKTAYLVKPSRGQMARLQLDLRYGNEASLRGQVGPANALPALLEHGTRRLTRQQIQDAQVKLGAEISIDGGTGLLRISLAVRKENLAAALRHVGELLREPTFPDAEFDIYKAAKLQRLTAGLTEPAVLANEALQRRLATYPKDDVRYVETNAETLERIRGTTVQQVRDLYASQVSAGAGQLAVVGDFDPAVVEAELGKALAGWTSAVPYKWIETRAQPRDAGERVVIRTPDKANAVYSAALAFPMTDRDPDYAALVIGNAVLGGDPFASRLGARIRNQKGLSYHVGSAFGAGSENPYAEVTFEAITNPANMGQVAGLIAEEVARFLKDGVTQAELDAARQSYLDGLRQSLADDGSVLGDLATGLKVGRTTAYYTDLERQIRALTPADITRAYNKVLDPKKLVVVEAGDFPMKK